MKSPSTRFYGWWLVGFSLLINTAASGPIWGGTGVWVKALELHFGWSRTQLTGAFSLAQLEGSFIGPVVGFFIDRLGSRRMVLIGLLGIGVGFILFSSTTNLAVFYLSFAVLMLGSAAGTWLPLMTALNRWFVRRRGIAMGIAGGGYFLGGVLAAPVLAWAVNPAHIGWRASALWIGIIFLVVAWPLSRSIRNRPEQYGQHPDGDPFPAPAQARESAAPGVGAAGDTARRSDFTVRQAVRTRAFWLITFGHGLSSMLVATMTVHLVPMLTDQGLSLQMAANVWATLMGVGVLFQLIGGYVGDRVPKNLAIYFLVVIQTGGFDM